MTSCMRNQLTKLYNTVSAPVAATRDALAERLQGVRDTPSLLYNRMMENMGYGQQERLKDIMEKEAEEGEQQQEEEKDWLKDPWLLKFEHFKTQEMCNKVYEVGLVQLKDVPDQCKTQGMCDKAVYVDPWSLRDIPDQCKMQEMCNEAFWEEPYTLECIPDQYITQGMYNEVVCGRPRLLKYIPDWFVTQEDIDLWYDDDRSDGWYHDYKKRKAQKEKIKE